MKKDPIKEVSLLRLREKADIPSLNDDLLVFEDVKMLPQLKEPRRMNCLIVAVCTKGSASYLMNQHKMTVKAGEAIVLAEGEVIDQIELSEDIEGVALLISYSFLYEIIKDMQNLSTLFLLARRHPVFALNELEIENAKEYFELILRKVKAVPRKFTKDVIRLLLLTMLYDLGDAFYRVIESQEMTVGTRAEQIFVHYIQLVEHHFKEQRRVSWYADKIGITPKYLSETVSNISHKTPNDWIEQYVTAEIRNLLRKTNKKISEIAEEMNFPNQSFLGKYFKENVGMSPSDYRKEGKA